MGDSAFRYTEYNIAVTHFDDDWVLTIRAGRLYSDHFTWKQPAHGQRFQPSLAKPLLLSLNADLVVVRTVREWAERHDRVVLVEPPRISGCHHVVQDDTYFIELDA